MVTAARPHGASHVLAVAPSATSCGELDDVAVDFVDGHKTVLGRDLKAQISSNQHQMNGLTRRRLGLFWLEAPQLVGVPVLERSDLALADDLKLAEIGLARHVVEAGWYQSI